MTASRLLETAESLRASTKTWITLEKTRVLQIPTKKFLGGCTACNWNPQEVKTSWAVLSSFSPSTSKPTFIVIKRAKERIWTFFFGREFPNWPGTHIFWRPRVILQISLVSRYHFCVGYILACQLAVWLQATLNKMGISGTTVSSVLV